MAGGEVQFSAELRCLAAMRQARADFFAEIISLAEAKVASGDMDNLSRETRKALRSDAVAQIAEFFFALEEGGTSGPDAIRRLLELHNADMKTMIAGCERGYTRYGLSAARLKAALFSEQQIGYLEREAERGGLTFDQRSIGKLLTQVMSFESCRSLLVLLAEIGLVNRYDFRSVVLISSNGSLEALYRKHLSSIVAVISKGQLV